MRRGWCTNIVDISLFDSELKFLTGISPAYELQIW